MPAKDPDYHSKYRQRNLLKTRDQTAARVDKHRKKWRTVPAHLHQRTRNRPGIGARIAHKPSPYPLTPILRCGHCGATMRGVRCGDNGKEPFYYACSDRRRYGTCSAPFVPTAGLEGELLNGWPSANLTAAWSMPSGTWSSVANGQHLAS